MKKSFIKKIIIALSVALLTQGACTSFANTRKDEKDVQGIQGDRSVSWDKLMLWYDEPAKYWDSEALPIGNGHMGGMIFGNVSTETIQYNEKTLWSGGPGSDSNYNWGNIPSTDAVNQITEILKRGEYPSNSLLDQILGDMTALGSYQNFGDILLDFDIPKDASITNYRRELDIEEGIARVKYTYNGVNYTREYFCNYPDNVMVIKVTSDSGEGLNLGVRNNGAHANNSLTVENNTITLKGAVQNNGMKYESQIKVINEGGSINDSSNKINVTGADSVTIIMAAGTDYENVFPTYKGEDPHNKVTERINNAVEKGYDNLKERHLEDYQGLFGRVDFKLGELNLNKPTDELLADYKVKPFGDLEVLLFQYGRYLTIASSREGSLPSNLQGVWNNSNNPIWNSDYHFNVNIQMNYWAAETTNLSECAIPLVEYIDSLREPGRITAKDYAGIDDGGWMVQVSSNPFGMTGPHNHIEYAWSATSNAWVSQNLWEHYEFTQDKEYLRTDIYPTIREAAELWAKWLMPYTHSDGNEYLVAPIGYSPEQGRIDIGTTYDQSLIYMLFTNVIEASEILGVDEDFRAELIDKRDQLLMYQIGKHGQIQEWKDDKDDPNNTHRHASHLMGLYPGNLINEETPELMDAAKVTLNHRGDQQTGWSMANKMNLWARTGDGDRAYKLLKNVISQRTLNNLFNTHPPMQLDGNYGSTAGISEMLLQSHLDKIVPIPAIPAEWKEGSYKGLKARGNFEVDAAWSNNSLNSLGIRSGSGNECVIEYKGLAQAKVTDSQGNNVDFEVVDDNTIKFNTVKDGEYNITGIPMELPEKTTGLKALRSSDNDVTLTWNDTKFAEYYDIYRKGHGEFEKIATEVKENTYVDTTAVENDDYTYFYYVVPVNSIGIGEASDTVEVEVMVYLSDLDWVTGTSGWNQVTKDRNVLGNSLVLRGENGNITYNKGIGVHSRSEVVYDLEGLNYYNYFESYVGIDQDPNALENPNKPSVTFEVWVDGVKEYDSGVMTYYMPQKFVKVDIKDAKELKIIVTDGGDQENYDVASWCDTKLVKVYTEPEGIVGDFNKNGSIDLGDLAIASKSFGKDVPEHDLNKDGIVNDYEINYITERILSDE